MRRLHWDLVVLLLFVLPGPGEAATNPDRPSPKPLLVDRAKTIAEIEADPFASHLQSTMRDTIDFGYYEVRDDGLIYAQRDGKWTWDHGAADPMEGWEIHDLTTMEESYFRQMTQERWTSPLEGNPLPWPQITGMGMVLCGAGKLQADSLGYVNGTGYGNDWCQRLVSPTFRYAGSGGVDISFRYFQDSEQDYDYTKLTVVSGSTETLLNAPGFTGKMGVNGTGVLTPILYTRTISNLDFGGGTAERSFALLFTFTSDVGYSDEDGSGSTDSYYGPFGFDDVHVAGLNLAPPADVDFAFENDLEGWAAEPCPGIGTFAGVAPVTNYTILDPCACELAGNIVEFHDSNGLHPGGQHVQIISPIIDRRTDIGDPAYLQFTQVMADWDMYAVMPQENSVYYRIQWMYYPYEAPHAPGVIRWSPSKGQETVFYVGPDPLCYGTRNIATEWGIPPTATKVRAIFEVLNSCPFDPGCSGVSNVTPLIDNFRVRNVAVPDVPVAPFGVGGMFHDGFGQTPNYLGVLNIRDAGNANITYNLRQWYPLPEKMGDSLNVKGPVPVANHPETFWESRLWFRLKRVGPGQGSNATFSTWKNAVAAAKGDFFTGTNPNFAWGYMDSCETNNGATVKRDQFCSQFRDGPSASGQNQPADANYNWGGGGEQGEGNEILPDGVFTPGTKIEYFISTNYLGNVLSFLLPDTSGGNYAHFEILPSYRHVGNVDKFPCVLWVNPETRPMAYPSALNVILNGAGPGTPIPDLTKWDRWDYLDPSSSWHESIYRNFNGNGGATIPQLLGYQLILVAASTLDDNGYCQRDFLGYNQWLTSSIGNSNAVTQGLILDGTQLSNIIDRKYPALLSQRLGAIHTCSSYNELGCPPGEVENDENNCVRVNAAPGAPWDMGVASDIAFNWCPVKISYSVMGTTAGGVGSKAYVKINPDGTNGQITNYAQVTNDQIGGAYRYRTVLGDLALGLLRKRDPSSVGLDECNYTDASADSAAKIEAAIDELGNAIKWAMNISEPPTEIGFCENPIEICCPDVDEEVAGGPVTRLYQNRPNPFNPRTLIRFSLAADGPAKVVLYDAQGRKVRVLVEEVLKAGMHDVVWDGTDQAGRTVASGVYWSQLESGGYRSNRKLVVLK